MSKSSRIGDSTVCPQVGIGLFPHVGGSLFNLAPVHLELNSLPAARLSDMAMCQPVFPDVVFQGSATVVVCGLPFARQGDLTSHGATVSVGSPDVEVGGPAFSLPANFSVEGGAIFRQETIRDLYFLSTTQTGQLLINTLAAPQGNPAVVHPIRIIPESNPHNSFAAANNRSNSANGIGTGSVVRYNPHVAVDSYDALGGRIPLPPQVVLAHELIHAIHFAMGNRGAVLRWLIAFGINVARGNAEEELFTIGTGRYVGAFAARFGTLGLTENDLRLELGLTRRVTHAGYTGVVPIPLWGGLVIYNRVNELQAPTVDFRPGAC